MTQLIALGFGEGELKIRPFFSIREGTCVKLIINLKPRFCQVLLDFYLPVIPYSESLSGNECSSATVGALT